MRKSMKLMVQMRYFSNEKKNSKKYSMKKVDESLNISAQSESSGSTGDTMEKIYIFWR
jgi:hypothetical protein